MIVGFNHNISYRGTGFHVQTEDSGIKTSQLVTLLYHGGTIIASQKTVYADILKVDNLSQVVEDLAKEQHKGMLRRLTRGEFDQRIIALGIPLGSAPGATQQNQTPVPEPVKNSVSNEKKAEPSEAKTTPVMKQPTQAPAITKIVEEKVVNRFSKPEAPEKESLEDLIFAYLVGADR